MNRKLVEGCIFTVGQILAYINAVSYFVPSVTYGFYDYALLIAMSITISCIAIQLFYRFGGISSWKVYSTIIHSKKLNFYIMCFFFAPTLIKALNIVELNKYITPFVFVYWACGFMFLIFIVLFYTFSPKVYRYGSLDSFVKSSGSRLSFRDDVKLAIETNQQRKDKGKLAEIEESYFDEDMSLLNKFQNGMYIHINDLYSVLIERLAFSNHRSREATGFFLVVPLFVIIPIFMSNVLVVVYQGVECTSWPDFIQNMLVFKMEYFLCNK
ncbi:hypothetical protein M1D72_01390 [Vibrio sp. AK197]